MQYTNEEYEELIEIAKNEENGLLARLLLRVIHHIRDIEDYELEQSEYK